MAARQRAAAELDDANPALSRYDRDMTAYSR
jgi:hypothetical protein